MPSKNPSKKAIPLKNLLRTLLRSVLLHDHLGVHPKEKTPINTKKFVRTPPRLDRNHAVDLFRLSRGNIPMHPTNSVIVGLSPSSGGELGEFLSQARKRHININFLVRLLLGRPREYPGDKPGLSLGQTHFVPGTRPGLLLVLHNGRPVCPRDLSAPKSRDSLRLRRRFLPLPEKSRDFLRPQDARFPLRIKSLANRDFSAMKTGKNDPRCGVPCDTLVCGNNR